MNRKLQGQRVGSAGVPRSPPPKRFISFLLAEPKLSSSVPHRLKAPPAALELKLRLEPERRALRSTEKRAALETDLLMERHRGQGAAAPAALSSLQEEGPGPVSSKVTGAQLRGRGGRKGGAGGGEKKGQPLARPSPSGRPRSSGWDRARGPPRLWPPPSWQEVCGAGPEACAC